jgi:transporter family protein
MWIILAIGASVTGALSVFWSKVGTGHVQAVPAAFLSNAFTFVVMLTTAILSGASAQIVALSWDMWLLEAVAGIIQGFSWLVYFRAIECLPVNLVMTFDKSNLISTMFLSTVILHTALQLHMCIGASVLMIGVGLMLKSTMLQQKPSGIIYAILSPTLQAVSNVFVKMDVSKVNSILTTTIRAFFVMAVLWVCCMKRREKFYFRQIDTKSYRILFLTGGILAVSYLLMYRAIAQGDLSSVTVIVKSNIVLTAILARIYFREQLKCRGIAGCACVLIGMVLFLKP